MTREEAKETQEDIKILVGETWAVRKIFNSARFLLRRSKVSLTTLEQAKLYIEKHPNLNLETNEPTMTDDETTEYIEAFDRATDEASEEVAEKRIADLTLSKCMRHWCKFWGADWTNRC
jgi:hypothetical protein